MIIKTTKFKTRIISLRFKEVMGREHLAYRAILPGLMVSKSPKFPSRKQLSEALDDLYGASLVGKTYRQGNVSFVEFSISFISPAFTEEPLLEHAISLLHDVVYGHKALPKSEFEIEKRLATEKVMAYENEKTQYALGRMLEVMFEGDNQSLRTQSTKEDLNSVTYAKLNNYYKKFLKNSMDVVLSGDFSDDEIDLIYNTFKQNKQEVSLFDPKKVDEHSKELTETDHIAQAKVSIGYSLDSRYNDSDYYATVLFNIAFGGGVHSRLFLNVREKHSLCYYISSSYNPYKGFLFVYSGIDKERVNLALEVIDEQILDLQTNELSIEELRLSKNTLINQLKETEDSQGRQMDAHYFKSLIHMDEPLEDIIAKIEAVTPKEVLNSARKLKKNTLYILAPEV